MRSKRRTGVGTRLRYDRLAVNLTLRDLEALAGVSNAVICQIENGHVRNPGINTIARLAKALRCDPSWLAFGE